MTVQVASNQVSVSTTAVQLAAARVGRKELRLKNVGSTAGVIFIGPDNSVSVSNGYPVLLPGTNTPDFFTGLPIDGEVWAIRSAGSTTVGVLEIYE